MKNLKLRCSNGRFFLNTGSSDEFVAKHIKELQRLVDVHNESSTTIVSIIAIMVGGHSIIASYICENWNLKRKESENEGIMHCDK